MDQYRIVIPGALLAGLLGLTGTFMGQSKALLPDAGEAWTSEPSPLIWESIFTTSPPAIDGLTDSVWQTAKPLTVTVREALGGDHPFTVTLRALHTDNSICILAQWADSTRSDMRDPYIWNAAKGEYDRPSKPDDQFAIEFPIKGDFAVSMLTVMREYTTDVWHWKAGRGSPLGWVDDKYHVISQKPVPNANKHDLHGGRSVYILRSQDAGQSAYIVKPKPNTYEGDTIDSFIQQEPSSSLADVRGKGVHDGQRWSLEMSRKFSTGHQEDDAVIDPTRDNTCAIAVLNDELFQEHSVSTVITLRFVGKP